MWLVRGVRGRLRRREAGGGRREAGGYKAEMLHDRPLSHRLGKPEPMADRLIMQRKVQRACVT